MTTRRRLAASVLAIEALVVLLGIAVAVPLYDVSLTAALVGGLGLSLGCLVAAGTLRSAVGFVLGSLVQVAVLASGVVVPPMVVVGVVFGGLWVTALVLGAKAVALDRERGTL